MSEPSDIQKLFITLAAIGMFIMFAIGVYGGYRLVGDYMKQPNSATVSKS